MQHLTAGERERFAYISGDLYASHAFAFMDEAEGHGCDDPLDVAEAAQYRSVATDFKAIASPEDLRENLEELWAFYAALPDNVSDAKELAAWASTTDEIVNERDRLKASLEAIAKVLRKNRAAVGSAEVRELVDWIDYALNEDEEIDAERLALDMGLD
jgi:hypothetical protein